MPTLEQLNRGANWYDDVASNARVWANRQRELGGTPHADEFDKIADEYEQVAAEIRSIATT